MAGRAKRTQAKEKRKKERAHAKEARKALYQSFAAAGRSQRKDKSRSQTRSIHTKDPNNAQSLAFYRAFPKETRLELKLRVAEMNRRLRNGLMFSSKGEAQYAKILAENTWNQVLAPARAKLAEQIANPSYQGSKAFVEKLRKSLTA